MAETRNHLNSLCYRDPRNPMHEDIYPAGVDETGDCFCDNCFYGRHELALEIIRTRSLLWLATLEA